MIRAAIKVLAGLWGLAVFCSGGGAIACPACREALAADSQSIQQGYALSIMLMIAIPCVILALWGVAFFRLCRKATTGAGHSAPAISNRNP